MASDGFIFEASSLVSIFFACVFLFILKISYSMLPTNVSGSNV